VSGRRLGLIATLAVLLGSCTAMRVVTHTTNADPVAAPAGAYQLDARHCSVVLDVDHLGYSRFVMRFDRVSAALDFVSPRPEGSRVVALIDAASIDTNDAALDQQVKGPALLDSDRGPSIRFESTGIRRTGAATGEMTGTLTILGRSVPVVLQVTFNGGAPNPLTGAQTLGFSATGWFDRSDFGLTTWFPAVGNRVNVAIQAEFVKG